jgi:hypothetical protein
VLFDFFFGRTWTGAFESDNLLERIKPEWRSKQGRHRHNQPTRDKNDAGETAAGEAFEVLTPPANRQIKLDFPV